MPHGVLFRGGKERDIRKGIIEDDRLEAVIGLAPNLFYGTGIPACILVLRGTGSAPGRAERQGPVHQRRPRVHRGSGAELPRPAAHREDRQRLRRLPDIPGFARVVHIDELADNDFNLNIRRYVDNTPPPEPQDVRAHLHGGVPEAEVDAHAAAFTAYGIDVACSFLRPRRAATAISRQSAGSRRRIDPGDGLPERGRAVRRRSTTGGTATSSTSSSCRARHAPVMETRADLLDSFVTALEPLGLLDRYQLAGVIASWWGESPVRHQDPGVPQVQRRRAGLADHDRGRVRARRRGRDP